MKIAYEKIIEKANARKLALENIALLLEQAAEHDSDLAHIISWVEDVKTIYSQLDAEGIKLLPTHIQTALAFIHSTHSNLKEARVAAGSRGVWFLAQPDQEQA